MLYAENIGLRDCSGFLKIGSHMVVFTASKAMILSALYLKTSPLLALLIVMLELLPLVG